MAARAIVLSETDVPVETWADPVRGDLGFRTLVGRDSTTDSLTAGVSEVPPGGWLGLHRHAPAEVYHVLGGHGTVTLDGDEHAVGPGSVVFIPGGLEHGIRNTRQEELRFFYAFAVGSMAEVEYHFSAAD